MKRVVSIIFAVTMLVICGAAKADDVEDCGNAKALLKANPSRAVSACRRLADQGNASATSTSCTNAAKACHRTMPRLGASAVRSSVALKSLLGDAPGGVSLRRPDRNVPLTIAGLLWSVPVHR